MTTRMKRHFVSVKALTSAGTSGRSELQQLQMHWGMVTAATAVAARHDNSIASERVLQRTQPHQRQVVTLERVNDGEYSYVGGCGRVDQRRQKQRRVPGLAKVQMPKQRFLLDFFAPGVRVQRRPTWTSLIREIRW